MSYSEKYSTLFNDVAKLYDKVRPGYPGKLIKEVLLHASVPEGGKILEVGCGTGQLTVPLAAQGYEISAIDRGPDMVRIANQKCKAYPQTQVFNSTFEDWKDLPASYDLLTSAQAFHWFDQSYGIRRADELLKPTGSIALIWNVQRRSRDTDFWHATNPIYKKYDQASTAGHKPLEWSIDKYINALKISELFSNPIEFIVEWNKVYSHDEYLMLLNTYSDHLALPDPQKNSFFSEISKIIKEFGGQVERLYETIAIVSKKRVEVLEQI